MKRNIVLSLIVFMGLSSIAQSAKDGIIDDTMTFYHPILNVSFSVKNGILYDTLTTIENEDLIVSEAILVFNEFRDHGDYLPYAEIYVSVLSKKSTHIKHTKNWIFCSVTDDTDSNSVAIWGEPTYKYYWANSSFFHLERSIKIDIINRQPFIHLDCKEQPENHLIKGIIFEYYVDGRKKYFAIDKFKLIEFENLGWYFKTRNHIRNTKPKD